HGERIGELLLRPADGDPLAAQHGAIPWRGRVGDGRGPRAADERVRVRAVLPVAVGVDQRGAGAGAPVALDPCPLRAFSRAAALQAARGPGNGSPNTSTVRPPSFAQASRHSSPTVVTLTRATSPFSDGMAI